MVYRTYTNARTRVAFGWLRERRVKKLHARELSRNQSILCYDVILQHDWPIEQCHLHIRVFLGGKTKSPCFDLFIHWLTKQIANTHRNHFSRSYENTQCNFEQLYRNDGTAWLEKSPVQQSRTSGFSYWQVTFNAYLPNG